MVIVRCVDANRQYAVASQHTAIQWLTDGSKVYAKGIVMHRWKSAV